MIKGIYAHPKPFWEQNLRLDDYGVNATFIHSTEIDEATLQRAQREGCKVFAEFATLNGKYGNYAYDHPEAHPMDDQGNQVPPATWFLGACPTDPGFRSFRMQALKELLAKYPLDGVWMDYIHWHAQFEDPYPQLVKTCFNDSCLNAFQIWANCEIEGKSTSEKSKWIFMNKAREWEDWRVSVILDWAREFRETVKISNPQALVGCYHCAWKDEDLGGLRRRCLGLDIEALKEYVDVFSPMVYHGRSGKTPDYVRDYVEYFTSRYHINKEDSASPQLWPIVQAQDEPRITPEEFEKVLHYGMSGGSTGVMMFTIGSVAADKGKLEAMKRVYQQYP